MENSDIRIYQLEDGKTEINVQLDIETVWLNLNQMVDLSERDKSLISAALEHTKPRNCERFEVLFLHPQLNYFQIL